MPSSDIPPVKLAADAKRFGVAAQSAPLTSDSSKQLSLSKRSPSQPPWYYRMAIGVLKPLYRLQVWRRSHQRDNYQQEVAQRFGKHYPLRPQASASQRLIWCHAVSLGETNTVAPLLDALLAKGYKIWLTNTTQTGFARGASLFANEIAQGTLAHSYVPVDSPAVIETFLAHVQPAAALFVETELWANILTKLSEHNIPSILVNGRLSAASFQRYQKIGAVSASMMSNLTLIIAQDEESAQRFHKLGADSSQIRVTGSLKWLINTPKLVSSTEQHSLPASFNPQPKAKLTNRLINELQALVAKKERPIWLAASTHSGEERAAIALHKQLLSDPAMINSLLIIVPRHPERFDEVATIIKKSELQMARRSADETITAQTQVYLADSMGELMQWYALADVALVGGSLVDIGGHNPVEPASVATPVLIGQYTQSCQSVVDQLASVGALYQPNNNFYEKVSNSEQPVIHNQPSPDHPAASLESTGDTDLMVLIYKQLQFWLSHPQSAKLAGAAGEQLTADQQSILRQQLTMIEEVVEQFAVNLP